jgi:hypothetical protein
VSRSLKSFAEQNRPEDWLSAKNCALQYNTLLEKAGAHKRKRGERHPSSGSTNTQQGETPGEIILKQLTQGFHLISMKYCVCNSYVYFSSHIQNV